MSVGTSDLEDIGERTRHVRFVPKPDILRCSRNCRYSITSSAVASSVCAMLRPSALAVLRLMTSSTLMDCWTGRSVGLLPLKPNWWVLLHQFARCRDGEVGLFGRH
jgi:hypothetical protein